MRRIIKKVIKNIILYIVIFILIFSSITPTALAYTPDEVGNAVAGFAKHVVDEFGKEGKNNVGYRQDVGDQFDTNITKNRGERGHCRLDNPIWKPNEYKWDDKFIYFDCTSFATGCYKYVTGLIEKPYISKELAPSFPSDMKDSFERIHWDKTLGSLKNGDLLCYVGHGWIYSGDGKTSENGYSHYNWDIYNRQDIYIYRVTASGAAKITNLNTEFSLAGTSNGGGALGKTIDYSNFFFNGVPDGKYSLATRKNIFEVLVDSIKDLVNFFTGLIGYLFRGFIIGVISIFDRLINNTVQSINDSPKSLEESGVTSTSADDPYSMNRAITIEKLIFNELDLFDINIFKVD